MTFIEIVIAQAKGMFPDLFYYLVLGLIPFIIAEQRWPGGKAPRLGDYGMNILIALSMFYHSAIRVQLPWLDRILVTPQVHRIHHSTDPAHHNRTFADALPIFDIVVGTYHRPAKDEFPATGLGPAFPAPRSIWSAQFGPLLAVGRMALPKRSDPNVGSGEREVE